MLHRLQDRDEFKRGNNGEKRVATFLRERGWHVLPSYDYSGEDGNKAPKLEGNRASFVIPDLDAARDGTRYWVEVKTKGAPVEWRKTGELRHGFSLRHIWEYKQVERITGCKVYVVIYEENSGKVICAPLSKLLRNLVVGEGTRWAEKMAFWPRSDFTELGDA